jgi:2,3-bisphosphoglycerate-independent phosphoglycerate mutase
VLEGHPVNLKRAAAGKDKANSIWPWSPGYKPDMKTLLELYNLKSGSVISAVDLIRGIGVYAGLKVIEASDEAGHEGDVELKIKTIEYLDARVVKPILEEVSTWNEPVTIAILPDHPTPCAIKTHTKSPVPFIIYRPGETPDDVMVYDEFAVEKGSYGLLQGMELMQTLITTKIPSTLSDTKSTQ